MSPTRARRSKPRPGGKHGRRRASWSRGRWFRYVKSRKQVHCFAGPAPADAAPQCASWEIDGAEFMSLEEARKRIHPDQRPFLDRLEALLAAK